MTAGRPPKPDAANGSTYTAPALEKGLDILELLADSPAGMTQNQIAAALGRSIGELFRMLEVLERREYLTRSGGEGRYRLTLKLFDLAHRLPRIKRLAAVALPLMHELANLTRQSNHLVVHHDRRILVVAQVDSPEAMGFAVRIGGHFPFRIDRVSARTLTAFQPPAIQQELIQELIDNDPAAPSRRTLQRMLAQIRARGFEENESATLPGITDICCPILGRGGHAVATLTQPWLRQRDVAVTLNEAREAQRATVARISQELGADELS
ncbi:MAG: IclR family transcriptional regulator [Lautropia sp.]